MNPATKAALTGARRHPRQLLLTGLAVLVATVFAAGSVLLTDTLRAALVADAVRTPAGAAAVVDDPGGNPGAPEALAARLRSVPGVTDVAVARSGYVPVSAGAASGSWEVVSDPMGGPLSRLPAPSSGRAAGPGQVLVGAGTAARTGLAPGATLAVQGRPLTVVGVVTLPQESTDTVVLTQADAATVRGTSASQIDVAGTPDVRALSAASAGTRVRTGEQQRDAEVDDASTAVTAVLAGLSVFVGLALVAAAVVVASTFRIVLARRGRELALLRCVGASRSQVTRSVLAEAALTGVTAGVGGTALAIGGGYAALAIARLAGVEAPALVLSPVGLVGCVLLAVAATVLAALPPAIAAGRVPPVVALGAADATEGAAPRMRTRLPAAAVLVALAAAIAVGGIAIGDPLGGLALVAFSGLLVFAALVVSGPFLVAAAGWALRPLVTRWAPARLAVANARRVSRRTAAMTTVLALGVGLTAALLVGVDGAAADSRASIDRNFPADVLIVPTAEGGDRAVRATELARRLSAADPRLRARADDVEVLVDVAPGADPREIRTVVGRAVGSDASIVTWTEDLRRQTESAFAVARAIGAGLIGTTLLVAVVGVGVTLALSVNERTREIALLRALGLTRSGARRAVAAEAALAGTVGSVLGAVLGAVYGELGLAAAYTREVAVPPPVGQLVLLAVAVVVVAVLASTAPMRRAGKVAPAHGLAAG